MEKQTNFRSGFVTIWGRPNVGKSTLLNNILKYKITIVSDKPQTTRKNIKGILNRPNCQIVFIDTPGLHVPVDPLGQFLSNQWKSSLPDADCLLYLTTPGVSVQTDEIYLKEIQDFPHPVLLVVNKIDLFKKEIIQKTIQEYSQSFPFHDILEVSALTGVGLDQLIQKIQNLLPFNPPYFDEDQISDVYERDIVGEIIREKVWQNIHQEIPYGVEVRVEAMKEKENLISIRAIIYVEKDSHRKIIIGEKGSMVKKIGSEARKDLEDFFEKKVFLDLWVKTQLNWRKKPDVLRRWGYTIR
ncbi:MAG: GTPase Era [Candidatus Atribacteria bacterium]|nr:GTPase Era [Candidatus Atribacteria bacterium]